MSGWTTALIRTHVCTRRQGSPVDRSVKGSPAGARPEPHADRTGNDHDCEGFRLGRHRVSPTCHRRTLGRDGLRKAGSVAPVAARSGSPQIRAMPPSTKSSTRRRGWSHGRRATARLSRSLREGRNASVNRLHRGAGRLQLTGQPIRCARHIAADRLVHVLRGWRCPPGIGHLVFTIRRGLPSAVRAPSDHMARGFPEI